MFDIDDSEMDIKSLRKKLTEYNNAYYNDSISIIPDSEYDSLKDTLKSISPNDDYFKSIGAKVDDKSWKKVKHDIAMGSLNKVNTANQFNEWTSKVSDELLVITPKLDGMSIELIYDKGELIQAITRGDGETGFDITKNVLLMNGFQKTITDKSKLSVRGEILLSKDGLKDLNKQLSQKNIKEYKSCRNAASGIAQSYDGTYCHYLDIMFYDIEYFDGNTINSYYKKLQKITELKFASIDSNSFKSKNIELCFLEWQNKHRNNYTFDLDGMVIRVNDEKLFNELGNDGVNVSGAIAWKFESVKVNTTFLGYRWDIGKTKRITPVATFEPINILGATCSNASVHNVDYFNKYNLGVGDKIQIERANDIIPQIYSVIERINSFRIGLLTFCPMCSEKLTINGAYLECQNDDCQSGYLGNLEKYVDVLDIKDISVETIEKLYKEKLIKYPSDFYKLTIEDFGKLVGLGIKSGKKIIDNFNSKLTLDLPTFISSLNINGVSKSIVEKIVNKGYDNVEKLQNITLEQLLSIQGIKDITANKILNGLSKKKTIISELLKYITLEQIDNVSNKLNGLSFVFTGAINKLDKSGKRYKREMLQQIVRENGGLTPSSMSKGVSYLVQSDPSSKSSKTIKAENFGIKILGESSFFEILEGFGIEF